jgi:cytosine/adenosine deaminase-related metal-dependent hydrolase
MQSWSPESWDLENSPNPALFRARWVLPMSAPAIADGAVIIQGLSIQAVGSYQDLRTQLPEQFHFDCGDAVLFPGLINCHTHLDNSIFSYATPRGSGDMVQWVQAHAKATRNADPELRKNVTKAAWQSLVQLGTIAVADIASTPFLPEYVPDAPLWSSIIYEVLGFNKERAEQFYQRALQMQADSQKEFSGVWQRFMLAPHGPHSLNQEILQEITEHNRRRGDLIAIHCAESPQEDSFLRGSDDSFGQMMRDWGFWQEDFQAPGCSSVQYLKQQDILGPDLLAVHCVQVDDADIETLASSKTKICLCPRSNDYIGFGMPPVEKMQAAGLHLCLGTDGLASNDSLSLFDEMAFLQQQMPQLAAADILRWATLGGAEALRIDSALGSLAENKVARFLVYSGSIGDDPYQSLVSSISHEDIHWLGGKIDMRK